MERFTRNIPLASAATAVAGLLAGGATWAVRLLMPGGHPPAVAYVAPIGIPLALVLGSTGLISVIIGRRRLPQSCLFAACAGNLAAIGVALSLVFI